MPAKNLSPLQLYLPHSALAMLRDVAAADDRTVANWARRVILRELAAVQKPKCRKVIDHKTGAAAHNEHYDPREKYENVN